MKNTAIELQHAKQYQVLKADNTTARVYFVNTIQAVDAIESYKHLKQSGEKGQHIIAPMQLNTPAFIAAIAGTRYVKRQEIDAYFLTKAIYFTI